MQTGLAWGIGRAAEGWGILPYISDHGQSRSPLLLPSLLTARLPAVLREPLANQGSTEQTLFAWAE